MKPWQRLGVKLNILPHKGSVILVFCYLPYARLTDIFLRLRTQFRRDDIDLFQTRMMVPKKMPWQIIDQREDGQLAAVTRFLPFPRSAGASIHCVSCPSCVDKHNQEIIPALAGRTRKSRNSSWLLFFSFCWLGSFHCANVCWRSASSQFI